MQETGIAEGNMPRERQTVCIAGLVPWSSSDWQSKLRRTLRSHLDAEPEPAVEARPLGPLSQAGLPTLPSPPLGQAFAVLEALLDLAEGRRLHSELSSASQAHRDRWAGLIKKIKARHQVAGDIISWCVARVVTNVMDLMGAVTSRHGRRSKHKSWTLWWWRSRSSSAHDRASQLSCKYSYETTDIVALCRLLRSVVSAVLGSFKPVMQGCPRLGAAEAELHAAALNELHTSHSALQV